MFNYFKKTFFKLLKSQEEEKRDNKDLKISSNIKKNLAIIKKTFHNSNDLILREFSFGNPESPIKAALVYLEGLVYNPAINNDIMKPLMYDTTLADLIEKSSASDMINYIEERLLTMPEVSQIIKIDDIAQNSLNGHTILLIDGENRALSIGNEGWDRRSISEPPTEVVVRGPREGFTETLRTNTALLRRKVQSPNLILETMEIGERTKTKITIAYLADIADQDIAAEVKRRIKGIKTDAILESGYIEQFIEDAPFSPFSTIANSEKPDVVAAKILEGRIAILVDGSPMVLTVPMLFIEAFQSAEDYYSRPYYSSLLRIIRLVSFLISIYAPGVFVAIAAFHQELIPAALITTISFAMEGTPFPVILEALGMGLIFEILREAGVRLPKAIGQSISIVGALVIGEAVVRAGFISSTMVIIIAITAISSFVVTAHSDAESITRLIMTLAGGFLGLFGITLATIGLLIHLCSLRSFGTPYFAPFAPLNWAGLKDTIVRVPLWAMITRPRTIGWNNYQRESLDLRPHPPQKKKK